MYWNAHVWTGTTSLYWSVRAVDADEWACVLYGHHIQNEQSNKSASNFALFEQSSMETIWMFQKAFGDDTISTEQTKVWHKLFKEGQEYVGSDPRSEGLQREEHLGMLNVCGLQVNKNQWIDSARTRSWCGDSNNHCVWDFDAGSWHETCHGKIHSGASATRAEGTLCCSC